MASCRRCTKEVGLLGSLFSFNKTTGRCNTCEKDIEQAFARFRCMFINLCRNGMLSQQEWQHLHGCTTRENIDWSEALQFIRRDALQLLERTLSFAADGIITEKEERYFNELRCNLMIPPETARPFIERLNYLKFVSRIRQGN